MAASLLSCSRMARWVHHNAATLLLLQVRARNPTLFRCFIFVWHMIQQTQCTVSGTQTASSACRDRAHRPRLHRVRDSCLSRIPETGAAHLKAFATKRAVFSPHSPIAWIFLYHVRHQFVRKCNGHLLCLITCESYLYFRTNWYVPV